MVFTLINNNNTYEIWNRNFLTCFLVNIRKWWRSVSSDSDWTGNDDTSAAFWICFIERLIDKWQTERWVLIGLIIWSEVRLRRRQSSVRTLFIDALYGRQTIWKRNHFPEWEDVDALSHVSEHAVNVETTANFPLDYAFEGIRNLMNLHIDTINMAADRLYKC